MDGMNHFRFLPGLRRVRLRPDFVQLGSDPDRSYLLQLPDSRLSQLLDRLDGWIDETTYQLAAHGLGVARSEASRLLDLLRGKGLVVDSGAVTPHGSPEAHALALRRDRTPAAVLAARRRQRVFVNGTGTLARRTATTLRAAGLGRVWCADEGRRGKATLTVLVNCAYPPTLAARGHARRRLPYLTVAILDGSVHIGPMVSPGTTPCLRCVDLHYRDCLPAWHTGGEPEVLEAPVATLAAGCVASAALQRLDGERCAVEASTIEVRPSLVVRRREWNLHPDCGCVATDTRP